jgi:hypothetical protein
LALALQVDAWKSVSSTILAVRFMDRGLERAPAVVTPPVVQLDAIGQMRRDIAGALAILTELAT